MHILAVLAVLLIPAIGWSQVACFNYGTMLSCDSPGGNTLITPFGPTGGVITQRGEWGSSVTPYTVFEAPKPIGDLNRSIAPLRPVTPAPSRPVDTPYLPSLGLPLFDEPFLQEYRGELPPDLDLDMPPPLGLP